ncbi:MAG: PspA/IM30 family protein [Sedimentisphaerales bacterium]|nr:PspA/IM30 family protein [Sedimentisphaerales bacterium]
MGRIERLKAVTMARIEAFLASLEEPETVIGQLVREMADKVTEAARAEAKALSAVKADRRRLDAASGRVERLGKGATLAVKADELDTARQAIAAQIEAEREVEKCRARLETSESAYHSAGGVRAQLRRQLDELRLRKDDILARVRAVRQRAETQNVASLHEGAGGILEAIARMEMKVDEEEAQIEIQDQIRQTLGATFQHERAVELENDAEVNRRLDELKTRVRRDE